MTNHPWPLLKGLFNKEIPITVTPFEGPNKPPRRTTRDGRTDPAGPPGTDGRTKFVLKNMIFLMFNHPNPLDPLLKRLFNRQFHMISKGNPY